MKKKHILLGVTGSVACYKAVEIIRATRRLGLTTEVLLTKEAEEFIKPALFRAVSGHNVIQADLFKAPDEWDVTHVSLAERIDLLLVAPATANIIGKVSSGICDDMLSCVICATRAPVLFAPAMNSGMYLNKIVQGNISKLEANGYHFTGPIKGKLACGSDDIGHIQDIGLIINKVKQLLKL